MVTMDTFEQLGTHERVNLRFEADVSIWTVRLLATDSRMAFACAFFFSSLES